MSVRQSRKTVDPAARQGYGFPVLITLHKSGNQTVTNGVACYTVGSTIGESRRGSLILTEMEVSLSALGGTTGGTTVRLNINGVAQTTTVTVAYNAANKSAVADMRDPLTGKGIHLHKGDYVTIDVPAIPTGATPVAPADLTVRLTCAGMDIEG